MGLKATVYTGPGWSWCERVKVLLQDNEYEIEEKAINSPFGASFLEEFQNKFNETMRTIPQVVIDDKHIGGYAEVEDLIKGLSSINKV